MRTIAPQLLPSPRGRTRPSSSWARAAKRAALLLVAAVVAGAPACGKDKPTHAQCEQACAHAVELGREAYDKAALARIPPDKQAEARTKMRTEWRKARQGKFKDRIDDCAVQCLADADMPGVRCILAAKTVGEAHRCRSSHTKPAGAPRRRPPAAKIGPRPLGPAGPTERPGGPGPGAAPAQTSAPSNK